MAAVELILFLCSFPLPFNIYIFFYRLDSGYFLSVMMLTGFGIVAHCDIFFLRSVYDGEEHGRFMEKLEARIRNHDREIEKMCNFHYQGFVDSITELLKVRGEAQKLKVRESCWMWPRAAGCRWPCLSRRQGDLQRSLPTSSALWLTNQTDISFCPEPLPSAWEKPNQTQQQC